MISAVIPFVCIKARGFGVALPPHAHSLCVCAGHCPFRQFCFPSEPSEQGAFFQEDVSDFPFRVKLAPWGFISGTEIWPGPGWWLPSAGAAVTTGPLLPFCFVYPLLLLGGATKRFLVLVGASVLPVVRVSGSGPW